MLSSHEFSQQDHFKSGLFLFLFKSIWFLFDAMQTINYAVESLCARIFLQRWLQIYFYQSMPFSELLSKFFSLAKECCRALYQPLYTTVPLCTESC